MRGNEQMMEDTDRLERGPQAKCWYALYTKHQHEKSVAQRLEREGHETFLPLYQTVRRWRDRNKWLWLPLFPSYVFVRGGLEQWRNVLETPGVFAIVGFAGQPAAVPQEEIDSCRRVVENSVRVEPHPFLKCGDIVRVKYGPLAGLEGILVKKRNVLRLIISVEVLGRSVAIEVDSSCLERVKFSLPAEAAPGVCASEVQEPRKSFRHSKE